MTHQEFTERIMAMEGRLYRVSGAILRQLYDQEDAVQSAILRAWRYQTRLREREKFEAWVVRILIHECYALLKRRKREIPSENLPEMAAPLDRDEDLHCFFDGLPEKLKLVMVLFYVEGYSVAEIAHILRLPVGTVKSRLARGRERMRKDAYLREVQGL